ncbi:hypothetical protein Ga0451573_003980, partial [Peptococcaceae bacterium DYL19]|nr:hypothetical protein [Phosphitispora fastidiosa]
RWGTSPALIDVSDSGVIVEVGRPLSGGVAGQLDQPRQIEQRLGSEAVIQHEVPPVEALAEEFWSQLEHDCYYGMRRVGPGEK